MRPTRDQVDRDTAIPTGPLPPADRLDRLWEATRPADPSPEALDALWAEARARLDAPMTLPARRLQRGVWVGGLAAAAAVLLIVSLTPRRPDHAAMPNPAPAPSRVTVEVGQSVVFRIGDDGPKVERHEEEDPAALLLAGTTSHDFFNAIEGMSTP